MSAGARPTRTAQRAIPATLRTVCCYCEREEAWLAGLEHLPREGAEPVSHGICPHHFLQARQEIEGWQEGAAQDDVSRTAEPAVLTTIISHREPRAIDDPASSSPQSSPYDRSRAGAGGKPPRRGLLGCCARRLWGWVTGWKRWVAARQERARRARLLTLGRQVRGGENF